MELNNFPSNYMLLYNEFYNLIDSYGIKINTDYQFIYDEFQNHIINDTLHKCKNSNNQKLLSTFRGVFYQHLVSREWFNKLNTPEKCIELIKILRKNKIQKINDRLD